MGNRRFKGRKGQVSLKSERNVRALLNRLTGNFRFQDLGRPEVQGEAYKDTGLHQ